MKLRQYITGLALVAASTAVSALTFSLQPGQDIVGQVQTITVGQDTNITDIAQKYDVGYYQLVEANQGKDIDHLQPGDQLTIPTQYIIPNVPRRGIVINQAEMRLFYFLPGQHEVITYPVGIGRAGWNTPVVLTKVIQKQKHPVWYVPQSIQRDLALQGIQSPKSIPAGPKNPLGPYMLRLGLPTYLIHGSNDASTVGRRSSSGCIHLYNPDITALFAVVPVGTRVNIINNPYLFGWQNNQLYLEAHSPIDKGVGVPVTNLTAMTAELIKESKVHPQLTVNLGKAVEAAEQERGLPTLISS